MIDPTRVLGFKEVPVPYASELGRRFRAAADIVYGDAISEPSKEYTARLLTRYSHMDNTFRGKNKRVARLVIAKTLTEIETLPIMVSAGAEREQYRYLGDFTLFWTGAYPGCLSIFYGHAMETLDFARDMIAEVGMDIPIEEPSSEGIRKILQRAGENSYAKVSQLDFFDERREADMFRELAKNFDVVAEGLKIVKDSAGTLDISSQ